MNRFPTQCLRHSARTVARSALARTIYTAVVLLALASASITTMAQSFVDTDPALYRCAVLGDTSSCHRPASRPAVWYEEWVELGTRAQYLRYLGADADDAIAQARLRGEQALRHVVRVTRIVLSPEQAHARGTSQRIVPDEERQTLSITQAREETPLLHNDWSASLLALPSKCPSGARPNDLGSKPALERCGGLVSRSK